MGKNRIDTFEFKTADLSELELRVAESQHAARYGMSDTRLRGMGVHSVFMDELRCFVDKDEYAADSLSLNDDEWRWAVAFRKVLGVGHGFYENAVPMRRRQLERHYEELATHDTAKGRKAAKVVAVRVQYVLAEKKPVGRIKYNDQINAYNYLFSQQISRKP
jgi:hypothetical protein